MIIQCEQCRTKFKLDDSKVAENSIKVRCARCRHVFSVAGAQDTAVESASFEQNVPVYQIEEELEAAAESAPDTPREFDAGAQDEEVTGDETSLMDSFSFEQEDEQTVSETPAPAGDESEFFLPAADNDVASDKIESQEDPDDIDFGAFDFGDEAAMPTNRTVTALAMDLEDSSVKQGQAATRRKRIRRPGFLRRRYVRRCRVSTTPEEGTGRSHSPLIWGWTIFPIRWASRSGSKSDVCLAAQETAAGNPFSLDEIDFGDDLTSVAVQQVSTEELKPSQELLFAPLAAARDTGRASQGGCGPGRLQEEPAPLTAAARRKESPRMSGMLMLLGP